MVLWCFNVTVPDPVLLRCYQCSETTTNQKTRWAPVSLGLYLPSLFGAVSCDLCLPCCNHPGQIVSSFYPQWPKKGRGWGRPAGFSKSQGPTLILSALQSGPWLPPILAEPRTHLSLFLGYKWYLRVPKVLYMLRWIWWARPH